MNTKNEERYQKALKENDIVDLWHCIENACKAELIAYLKKINAYIEDPEDFNKVVDISTEMVWKRMTIGFSKGENKGKKARPDSLGAYCYTVVTNEYKKWLDWSKSKQKVDEILHSNHFRLSLTEELNDSYENF